MTRRWGRAWEDPDATWTAEAERAAAERAAKSETAAAAEMSAAADAWAALAEMIRSVGGPAAEAAWAETAERGSLPRYNALALWTAESARAEMAERAADMNAAKRAAEAAREAAAAERAAAMARAMGVHGSSDVGPRTGRRSS